MTTITREQALKIIEAADEVISALAGTNEDVHPGSDNMLRLWDDLNDRYAPPEVVRELARIALASLEAEPVAWECGENIILFNPDTVEAYAKRAEISPKPLYAAPPVSVTPDSWISCSERMPEMGERQCYVLAADFINNYPPNIPNTQVGVYGDWFNDGNPTWDDGDGEDLYLKEVTHWMPLPEAPQEVNRG